MSDIIQLLPDNIANQIAAGEVIQRPASVVKELMENAVDAGATQVELHIKDAGKTSITVVDDGKGMSPADARMCFERHATSKLKTADDLFKLTTKGFRGEAMASIAAIAHVDLETKIASQSVGTKISIAGSKVIEQEPIAKAKGTSIAVKNLFFNVPARRNFLKSDSAETKHIVEEFNRIALTHPEVGFKFSHNGNILHDLSAGGLRKRIVDLHGTSFNTKLVPVEEETDIVQIKGFVGKPEFARKTRGEQYFFVNNRYFKDHYLHHAVAAAFENLIPAKTHPSYFLYLTVPTASIDVNIHPTKTEIKFEEDRNIYSILRSAVKLALGVHNIAPTLDFEHEPQFEVPRDVQQRPVSAPQITVDPTYNPFKSGNTTDRSNTGSSFTSKSDALKPNKEDWENFYEVNTPDEEENVAHSLDLEDGESYSKRMQLHGKFLFTQIKSGVMVIHLKRAKERILYDELMSAFMLQPISSQQIMFPVEINLQDTEKLEWNAHTSSLQRIGFEWEFNKNKLILSAIPSYLQLEQAHECIQDIIQQITYAEIDKGELAHALLLSLSKSAAHGIKKNLQDDEIDTLTNQLFSCEDHQFTPDGKRIIETLSLTELNKRFN